MPLAARDGLAPDEFIIRLLRCACNQNSKPGRASAFDMYVLFSVSDTDFGRVSVTDAQDWNLPVRFNKGRACLRVLGRSAECRPVKGISSASPAPTGSQSVGEMLTTSLA